MPLIAKDTFAPMLGGTKYSEDAKNYLFDRRISRMKTNARVDSNEATNLVGRLSPTDTQNKTQSEIRQLAKDRYLSRSYSPSNQEEAIRFANDEVSKNAGSKGLEYAQRSYLGNPKTPSNPQTDLSTLVKEKAISDFHARENGVRGSLGKILYGNSEERHGVLKKLPVDLSTDTATGRVVNALGHGVNVGATALPAVNVGLGSAAQYNTLQKLRRNREFSGGVGKVAEGATTLSGLIRAGIFGPAATLMAAPALSAMVKGGGNLVGSGIRGAADLTGGALGGVQSLFGKGIKSLGTSPFGGSAGEGNSPIVKEVFNKIGSVPEMTGSVTKHGISALGQAGSMVPELAGQGLGHAITGVGKLGYRQAKDSAFGLTSMIGGGVLKGASGIANMVGGKGVDLGGSLAGAAKGVGFGASMAGMTPALVGGLALALPGIIGGITGKIAEKKQRIARGFKQPTDKLIKQFSRSLGIDSVLRTMFNSNAITSDRMLELQMLMYIEQNTSSIPKMVSDTGLMSDRKEKDGTKTIETHGRHQRETVESAYESDYLGSRAKRRVKYAWERGLADVQRFSHAINIPGQIADLLINRKTPFARKEEFRRAREDAKFQLQNPGNLKKAAFALNTSAGHVQLLAMSAMRLVRSSGAQSVESQQLALQAGIYDLLRLQFRMGVRNTLKTSGSGIRLTPRVAEEDVTGWKRLVHSIPILSSLLSAYTVGETGVKKIIGVKKGIQNSISDFKKARRGTLRLGEETSGVGRFLSKNIVGKEQTERLAQIQQIKEKMGLTKTNSEKIETFNLKLPEYWEELLHLGRQTVESLHNIFNVGNKALSYSGAGEIPFNNTGSEQKVFDFASGESLTQKDYKRVIEDRRDTFDRELSTEKPSFLTKQFRKVFGGEHSQTVQSPVRQKSLRQFSTDDDFKLKNASQIAGPAPLLLPGPTPMDPTDTQCCEGEKTILTDGFSMIKKFLKKLVDCCNEGNDCCEDKKRLTITKPTILDSSSIPIVSEQQVINSNIPDFTNTRSATDEVNENIRREKEEKENEFRKTITDGFKTVIKELNELKEKFTETRTKKDEGEGFFSKLGGLISGAFSKIALLLAPLIAAITPLIAPIAAVAAALGAFIGLNKFGKNSTWTGAAVDTVQDLGMAKTAITNAPRVAANVGSKIASGAKGMGAVAQAVKEGQSVKDAMTAVAAGSNATGPGKIAQAFGKTGEYVNKGITAVGEAVPKVAGYAGELVSKLPAGIGTAAKGIGKVASIASKANPALLVADSALQMGQDIYDPTRIDKRYEDFKNEMSNSGVLGQAWGLAKKVINPYEGGSVIGTGINKGINKVTEFMTGEKGATLGSKIYDWTHGDEKKAQEEALTKKLEENKKKQEARLSATSTTPSITPSAATPPAAKPSAATPPVINVKTESLETKTEEQTGILKTGLTAIAKSSDELLSFFKEQVDKTGISPSTPIFNAERKQWIEDKINTTKTSTEAIMKDVKTIATDKVFPMISDLKAKTQTTEQPAAFDAPRIPTQQMKESTSISLRKESDLPTVKELHRKEAQVKVPTHSSAPSAMNAGMSGSKSQLVKDRPINPLIDGFVDQLFNNTINALQQSIKSFAIGQTPFQILR